jgi:hypothetical protein
MINERDFTPCAGGANGVVAAERRMSNAMGSGIVIGIIGFISHHDPISVDSRTT